jgi:ankyrin repeat protein
MPISTTSPRWAALLLAGLALQAAADERDVPPRSGSYFSTQPADGRQNLQGGWPVPGTEYAPPPTSDTGGSASRQDSPPRNAIDADLALAVMRNDIPGAQAFIKAGANVNCSDCAPGRHAGLSPLMLAARFGAAGSSQNQMLRLLLRHGATPNGRTTEGVTALFIAAQAGLAPDNGALDAVAELLAAGVDPGLEARDGTTAIFWWAAAGIDPRQDLHPRLREELYRDFLAIAKSFHARGADLSHREGTHGMTALHVAAMHCNPHGALLMQAIGIDAATGDNRLLAPKELVERRIRDEGGSRVCRQTLDALNNPALVNHWKRIAFQVAPLLPVGR